MKAESDMPSWLDEDFVQTLLRDNEEDQTIVVQDIHVRSAVGVGENYSSRLHRVTVNLTKDGVQENYYLIVKSAPDSELMMQFLTEAGIFDRETLIHLKTIPSMYQLTRENSPKEANILPISCKVYKTDRPFTIVMDDLQQLGYKMADRHLGLDLVHSKLAMSAFARLHALSWGLQSRDPAFKEEYGEHLYTAEKREMSKQFTDQAISSLARQVENWEGFERFGEKLRNLECVDIMIEAFNEKNDLAVLNHGDAWVNNMMFVYNDEGQVKDIKLLDFQLSRFVSLGMDLQYFLHTSPNEDIRINHWDELLEEYHRVFVETLESIQYDAKKIPSLEAIKKEVDDKMFFGLFTSLFVLPIVTAEVADAPDMSKVLDSTVKENVELTKTHSAPKFRKRLEKILISFENFGIL